VQLLPVGARGFPRTGWVGLRGRVAVGVLALRCLRGGKLAVGAQEHDWVQSDEERAEDSCRDGFPSNASTFLETGNEEVESHDQS